MAPSIDIHIHGALRVELYIPEGARPRMVSLIGHCLIGHNKGNLRQSALSNIHPLKSTHAISKVRLKI